MFRSEALPDAPLSRVTASPASAFPDGHPGLWPPDKTVRFWDLTTETPHHVRWTPGLCAGPGLVTLTASCIGEWGPEWPGDGKGPGDGEAAGESPHIGFQAVDSSLAWEPLHLGNGAGDWSAPARTETSGVGHHQKSGVSEHDWSQRQCDVCESGEGPGLLQLPGQDHIKVWRSEDGALCRTLQGHGLVNVLALNTDYVIRSQGLGPQGRQGGARKDRNISALTSSRPSLRRDKAVVSTVGHEVLVSGSDDFHHVPLEARVAEDLAPD